MHGQDDGVGLDTPLGHQAQHVQSADIRHREIQQDDIGAEVDNGVDRHATVDDDADDVEAIAEEPDQALGHHHVVLDNQHAPQAHTRSIAVSSASGSGVPTHADVVGGSWAVAAAAGTRT